VVDVQCCSVAVVMLAGAERVGKVFARLEIKVHRSGYDDFITFDSRHHQNRTLKYTLVY
jgi:hypothetical protein